MADEGNEQRTGTEERPGYRSNEYQVLEFLLIAHHHRESEDCGRQHRDHQRDASHVNSVHAHQDLHDCADVR